MIYCFYGSDKVGWGVRVSNLNDPLPGIRRLVIPGLEHEAIFVRLHQVYPYDIC